MAPASKTYASGGTSPPLTRQGQDRHPIFGLIHRDPPCRKRAEVARGNKRDKEHFHVGCRHAGPRPRPLRTRHRLCLRLRTALTENGHDLRLFARRHRLRRPAVLPDLRAAAARTVLTGFRHILRNSKGHIP